MNKKGQKVYYGIMMALMLFIALVTFIDPVKTQVVDARDYLNCTSPTITTGTKAACLVTDYYFFGFMMAGFTVVVWYIKGQRKSKDGT